MRLHQTFPHEHLLNGIVFRHLLQTSAFLSIDSSVAAVESVKIVRSREHADAGCSRARDVGILGASLVETAIRIEQVSVDALWCEVGALSETGHHFAAGISTGLVSADSVGG